MAVSDNSDPAAAILVVGAGLAGLTIAYRLQQFGLAVEVVEARDRPGGRIHSRPHALGTTVTAELGGEAFDSVHVACLQLAQELGLPLVDLWQHMPQHLTDTYWFGGDRWAIAPLQREFTTLLQTHATDWQTVQRFIQTREVTDAIRILDHQSLADYLAERSASRELQQLVNTAYTIKYGMDAAQQSSLNLLCFFQCDRDCADLFGTSDERFYIAGGNSQLPQTLYEQVADQVQLDTVLEALTTTGDNRYRVTLRQGQTVRDRTYTHVVLTLPFSVLRQLPLQVELPDRKRQAIQSLAYNSPTKVITAYRHKPWQTQGCTGLVFTDLPIQHCWEASDSLRSPQAGLIVTYPGGRAGSAITYQDEAIAAQQVTQMLESIFPGLAQAQATSAMLRSTWLTDPFAQGAYACYEVGQWSAFYGYEGDRVGNLLFAGEHCSRHHQGYMEGACETAEQVVLDLLEDWQLTTAAATQRSRLQQQADLRGRGFRLG